MGASALLSGCASVPYVAGRNIESARVLQLRPDEPQIERGRPHVMVDLPGELFSLPTKLLMWNWNVDRHHISPNTESNLVQYLADNDLKNVKVRLNEYSPGGEWSRLFRNKSVGWGWRYTLGVLTCTFYAILPGRLFGGDNYNPYTDTINIYSDIPAVAMHEGGHAKDFAPRTYKGSYAFATALPLVALYPESRASGDVIGYIRTNQGSEEEKAAYKILYPAYATYIGGEFGQLTPWMTWIYLGALVPGHIAGRVKAANVEDRPWPGPSITATNAPPPTATNQVDETTSSGGAQQ